MGVGKISASEFWSEQVRLTPLTSDPTESEEGELWLRADLAGEDDQLATLRLDTGGSTVDIPVFDVAADVPDDVSTQLRLVVGGQQGFVPTVEDGGSIPQLGVWSDGVRHEAIEELLAIPDIEDLYARFSNQFLIDNYSDSDAINQWTGTVQNISLTQSTSEKQPLFDSEAANGTPSASSDGSDDRLSASGLPPLTDQNGFCAFVYFSAPSNSATTARGLFGSNISGPFDEWLIRRNTDDNYEAFIDNDGSGGVIGSAPASNVEDGQKHSLILSEESGTGTLYLDGSSVGSLDVSGYSLDATSLMMFEYDGGGNTFPLAANVVEAGVYAVGKNSAAASDIHQYLEDVHA